MLAMDSAVRLEERVDAFENRLAAVESKGAGSIDPVNRPSDSAVAEPKPARSVGRRAVDRVGDAFAFRPDRVTVIRPAARWPRLDLRELWHYRELLGRFVWRDVKVRYKQTFIGVAWAILQPFLTMVVFTLIFGKFAKFPNQGQQYPVFVYSGLLLWSTYFQSALVGASTSLVANVPLVTKVYFPRVLLPAGAVLVPIVDFIMASTVLVGLMAVLRHAVSDTTAYLAPRSVLIAIVTALGTGLSFSALNVRYRDVPYVIPFIVQTWLYRLVGRLSDRFAPAEVAVGARVQSDERGDHGLSLGADRDAASGHRPVPRRASHRRSSSSSSGSCTSAAPSPSSRTRSSHVSGDRSRESFQALPDRRAATWLRDAARHASPRCGRRIRQTGHHHHEEIWALKDVSFDVAQGEVLGVIGRNGAGKSTLLKVLTRITTPTVGPRDDPWSGQQPARGRNRLPSRADRPRERLPERRDPRHEASRDHSQAPRHRRVLGHRPVHGHAREALLERHVRAAGLLGRSAPGAGDHARRRGARGW